LNRHERLEVLLAETKRTTVSIRKTFVRTKQGADYKPGPLISFLTAHDERGLDAYLLAHAMASSSLTPPWDCTMKSDVWVSALGLEDNAEPASAKTAVSKIMGRLEDRFLITRERANRISRVTLLKEDGSREPYERPDKTKREDWWLQLPYAYWLERHYESLSLTAKVMLIIALDRPDRFSLPYEKAPKWYGVSSDSAETGLRALRDAGVIDVEKTWVKAGKSPTGWAERPLYSLQGSFSEAARKKAAPSRNGSAGEDDVEVQNVPGSGLLAPVLTLPQPTLEAFYAQPSPARPSANDLLAADGPA
jgi:hypothetical protein